MSRSALPWTLFVLSWAGWVFMQSRASGDDSAARAEGYQAAVDSIAPLTDSLQALAAHRDTVLLTLTDTLMVTVERVRVVQAVASDSLRARLDSDEMVFLDELEAAHAEEVHALGVLLTETRLWGQSWRDAAEALEAENAQLRLWGAAWERAHEAERGRGRWLKVGQGAAAALGFLAGRL